MVAVLALFFVGESLSAGGPFAPSALSLAEGLELIATAAMAVGALMA